jgi:hypothetical protein
MLDLVCLLHILVGDGILHVQARLFMGHFSPNERGLCCSCRCLARELIECESVAIIDTETDLGIVHRYHLALGIISPL